MKVFIKYILSVSAIIAFVVTVTLSFDKEIRADIKEMTAMSNEIEQYVLAGDIETAFSKYGLLNKKWINAKEKWCWMINHLLIKDVDLTVSNFGHYIDNSLPDDAIVEKKKLMKLFHSINDLDTLRLHNIF